MQKDRSARGRVGQVQGSVRRRDALLDDDPRSQDQAPSAAEYGRLRDALIARLSRTGRDHARALEEYERDRKALAVWFDPSTPREALPPGLQKAHREAEEYAKVREALGKRDRIKPGPKPRRSVGASHPWPRRARVPRRIDAGRQTEGARRGVKDLDSYPIEIETPEFARRRDPEAQLIRRRRWTDELDWLIEQSRLLDHVSRLSVPERRRRRRLIGQRVAELRKLIASTKAPPGSLCV